MSDQKPWVTPAFQFPGPKPKLDDVHQALLLQALRGPAPDGDCGMDAAFADYLSELIAEPISRQQGWEYLKQMRLRLLFSPL